MTFSHPDFLNLLKIKLLDNLVEPKPFKTSPLIEYLKVLFLVLRLKQNSHHKKRVAITSIDVIFFTIFDLPYIENHSSESARKVKEE